MAREQDHLRVAAALLRRLLICLVSAGQRADPGIPAGLDATFAF